MKRVSFKIAKAIKEVGYPQGVTRDVYVIKEDGKTCIEYPIGACISSSVSLPQDYIADVPYVMEVWLWLWSVVSKHSDAYAVISDDEVKLFETSDPEEAIIAVIEYLVDNDLLK